MRNQVALLGVPWLAAAACGGQSHGNPQASGGDTAASGGFGTSGSAGKAGGGASGGGSSGGASATGGAVTAGTANGGVDNAGSANIAVAGEPAVSGAAGDGGGSGFPDPTEILKVKPSAGCGKDATQATGTFVKYTIQTSGTKDADCADMLNGLHKCGPWSYPRDYYVWLPPNYDKQHAYPLVVQAPGCGGTGTAVYSLSPTNGTSEDNGVSGSVIRVGLTPPPNEVGHATNENQGCFDDREGDDSIEWPFYEALVDKLNGELCYDENRVFASGSSSGSFLSNDLACKYAGATNGYAIRGVAVNGADLPNQAAYVPTCTDKPMTGMWINVVNNGGDPIVPHNQVAIARAMKVNGCTPGTTYETAQHEDFPIGGGQAAATCQKILGCPEQYPLVVCSVPANLPSGHDAVANPGFATFLKSLEAP